MTGERTRFLGNIRMIRQWIHAFAGMTGERTRFPRNMRMMKQWIHAFAGMTGEEIGRAVQF
jgi:hypothetical protein